MLLFLYGVLVFCFLICIGAEHIIQLTNVSSCPLRAEVWQQRRVLKMCDEKNGFVYHCMKSSCDNFFEFCMVPVTINTYDGCPLLNQSKNLHISYVECSISRKCPTEGYTSYLSYTLYKYAGCYAETINTTRIIAERISITTPSSIYSTEIDQVSIVVYTSSNDTKAGKEDGINSRKSSTKSVSIFILVAAAGVIVLLGLMTTLICYIQKIQNDINDVYQQNTYENLTGNPRRQEHCVYNEIETTE